MNPSQTARSIVPWPGPKPMMSGACITRRQNRNNGNEKDPKPQGKRAPVASGKDARRA